MAVFQIKQPSSRPGTSQDITTGAASATLANPFGSETFQVRLCTTTTCRYRVVEAAGGTAVATDTLLHPDQLEYITVTPGQKIAAIQETAAGKLNVTEMS
ncbi:hypothetical protein GWE18_00340 [Bradyrhizobium sp. CSA112]|uniref:hypothetical protein n=1 Tax=Bradyrhizobium sp. CSA112 TaxID=2699170 RepID=UPI0023B14B09|nr:hypothetical protein [Bradyrhizobium sp. CSA112]MDE5451324.1 hypothetical protein [Bradyrhizobium sp. CSA112]